MKQKKLLSLLLVIVLSILSVACGGQATPTTTAAPAATEAPAEETEAPAEETEAPAEETEAEAEEPAVTPKVALIMEGSIADMSWNYTAHQGLEKIKALGAETAYVENVAVSDSTDAIRTFADEGYDVIYMSSSTYQDVLKDVAPDYPDVQFFIINAIVQTENITSIRIADAEQGFMMGVIAALMSETGKVGYVGGAEITPLVNGGKGFAQGAKYVNEDVETIVNFTGDSNNVDAAKELSLAMIGQDVDVLAPMANQASLGVMQAAEEKGVYGVANGLNMNENAPKSTLAAVVKDTSVAYESAFKAYLADDLPDDILYMGANYGVVYVSDFYLDVPQDVQDKVAEVYDLLLNGEIEIDIN